MNYSGNLVRIMFRIAIGARERCARHEVNARDTVEFQRKWPKGQGLQADKVVRDATEEHAMGLTIGHYGLRRNRHTVDSLL